MNISRRTRTVLIRATDNWLSRAYLAVVTAATGYFLFDASSSTTPTPPWPPWCPGC